MSYLPIRSSFVAQFESIVLRREEKNGYKLIKFGFLIRFLHELINLHQCYKLEMHIINYG